MILEKKDDFLDFGGENSPPIPALAVVFLRLLSGAGYTGKRYGKKAESLCGEDFKVRA